MNTHKSETELIMTQQMIDEFAQHSLSTKGHHNPRWRCAFCKAFFYPNIPVVRVVWSKKTSGTYHRWCWQKNKPRYLKSMPQEKQNEAGEGQ